MSIFDSIMDNNVAIFIDSLCSGIYNNFIKASRNITIINTYIIEFKF